MKKALTVFGAVIFASFMMTSCSQKPTEIKLSNLHTVCDYVDAIEKCVDAIIETKEDKTSISELPKEKQEYVKQLKMKIRDIERAANKKFTKAEAKECSNFAIVKEKSNSL